LPRLVQRYAAERSTAGDVACAEILAAVDGDLQRQLWRSLDAGLGNFRTAVAPQLARQLQKDWGGETDDVLLIRLLARTGHLPAQTRCLALAEGAGTSRAKRVAMLGLLSELPQLEATEPLIRILEGASDEPVRIAALEALGAREVPEMAPILLETFLEGSPVLRDRIAAVMFRRKSWAAALLQAVDIGRLASKDLSIDRVRQVALHGDDELDALVRRHWGRLTGGTKEERLAEVRRLNNDVRAGSGDFAAGREIYRQRCAGCHRLHGDGALVGPELQHANRRDRDYLLVSIVDPSSVIRKEYAAYTVQTVDGQVVTGLIVEQTLQQMTLVDSQGERRSIAMDRIDVMQESAISLMPENLLQDLAPQQLRDLFQFLQGDP
jgi:putative heme-binding domain-containing protein